MYPYTALNLKESKKNTLKDFVGVAGMFGVTHMMVFTQTEKGNYIRFIKNPKGPTLTFKIDKYSLSKDVVKYQQKNKRYSKVFAKILQAPPLLIMNGFQNLDSNLQKKGEKSEGSGNLEHFKIVSLMLQSMFPPIKVQSVYSSSFIFIIVLDEPD